MNTHRYNLSELARIVGGVLRSGDADVEITGIADLSEAEPHQASWVSSGKYESTLASSRAGVVLVPPALSDVSRPVIVCENIDRSVAALLGAFARPVSHPEPGVHPTAVIHDSAAIGEEPSIGPHAVIDRNVTIGKRCIIHAGVFIGRDTTIGDDCTLWPNVVIRDGCILGHRVTVFPGAVIGADGFGFYFDEGRHHRVPHTGGVLIGDDVEIGACSCVDRAKFGYTVVGRGTKIDNLVQVGHNVRIGEHCVLAGQVGVSGSVRFGDYCILGGQVGVTDNVTLGRGVRAAGGDTTITHDIPDGMTVSGYPAQEHRKELREQALIRRLPRLAEQLRALVERVERLESAAHNRP